MKYLVVIALLALLLVFLYRRLRPYLKSARDFLKTVRQVQQAVTSQMRQKTGAPEKLIQCARCGIWVPETRALSAPYGSALYCSAECVSGKQPSRERAES